MPAIVKLLAPLALVTILTGAVSNRDAIRSLNEAPTMRAAMTVDEQVDQAATAIVARHQRVSSRADTTRRTTMDGVYTTAQATSGSDVFAAQCRSCHTPTAHTGPPFRNKWYGRTLGELFGYLRREMPKNEPGSMSDDEYAKALAYLLRMNGMPAGDEPLVADSAALHRIRLDSVRAAPSTPGTRR